MVNYQDKRDYYRMMINSDVYITIKDPEFNSKLLATCRDLSATGIAVEIPHPIDLHTRVHVSIDSANHRIQPLEINGKVVRVQEEAPGCFLLGINISEVD